ncbi:short chain dehydrogenase [Yersinia enterocolitica]|nr:short chain dehydrogenase [Yersinia enterocolitica]
MQKTVLITGCSSGIGLVAAQDLKNRGYRVLAPAVSPTTSRK